MEILGKKRKQRGKKMKNETKLKTFNLFWYEEEEYTATVKAKNREEAEKKFTNWDKEISDSAKGTGDIVINEDSLEIFEVNE